MHIYIYIHICIYTRVSAKASNTCRGAGAECEERGWIEGFIKAID